MNNADSGDKLTSADADMLAASSRYSSRQDLVAAQERPFGVSVIVTLIVLGALLNAFLALNAFIRAQELRETPVWAFIFIIEVVIGVAVAFGLWGLREWARVTAIVLYSLSFLLSFFANFNEPLTAASLIGLVAPVAIVIYLIQPDVSDKFI